MQRDLQQRRRLMGITCAIVIVVFCLTPQFRSIFKLPPTLEIAQGNSQAIHLRLPFFVQIKADQDDWVKINGKVVTNTGLVMTTPFEIEPVNLGEVNLQFNFLGLVPIRRVSINVVPKIELIPGGQSIGVNLKTNGVLVVGHANIASKGQLLSPASDAGILVGDHILAVNDEIIESVDHIGTVINKESVQGDGLQFLVQREDNQLVLKGNAVVCDQTKQFRMGMYVRDNAAGVGTLTFIDPQTRIFGALGHVVTDMDTNKPLLIRDGSIVKASVTSVQLGQPGLPGQKHSIHVDTHNVWGTVEKNTYFGIFGEMADDKGYVFGAPIPVALMDQVVEGPAEIWTVIEGEGVEKFAVEINRAIKQYTPSSKGMIIEIIDDRLLNATGGIVQGMSGSPIIQNGRLIGAVTHVFLNNPARGYGCYIEFMILESGLIEKQMRSVPTMWPLRRTG